jgi:hypothetical protein
MWKDDAEMTREKEPKTDTPLYTLGEIAWYLNVPESTLVRTYQARGKSSTSGTT